ncbi:glycogen debranching N-terminal domain-containing protein [Luteibacter sp. NPDC031894]|uniref:amylo-alpha-1,6-glucosidase n=1 Tax=Luteibacter sp. NPDC031894 TaxID=3390572 RepID=UPI003CFBFB37
MPDDLPNIVEPMAEAQASVSQFALKEGDTFLVADAHGNVTGAGDGLFRNDTRVLSSFVLTLGGARPSLLSSAVSQDNLYFTAHLTNQPLPTLGSPTPQGVVHVERKRFLWEGRIYEFIRIVNYSDVPTSVPMQLRFAADFRDMFEVRGERRARRGEFHDPVLLECGVDFAYQGLDGVLRHVAIVFSQVPDELAAGHAGFDVTLAARDGWVLYLEVGAEPAEPSRARYRQTAARAWRHLRLRRQRGAWTAASGRLFQSWLDKSHADLALLTTDLPTGPYPYAGIPWFSAPFGRDAIVTSLQTLWLDPGLSRGVLSFLAEHQARETSTFRDSQPGKIMHETRKGEMASVDEIPFSRYYGGVDTTPLFVMLAGAYARRTGDREFIDERWSALESAAAWIENSAAVHPHGLLAYERGEASGLANQGWKDSHDSVFHEDGSSAEGPIALVEVQGYAYRAYRDMAELADWRGDSEKAEQWRRRAKTLRDAIEKLFWIEDMKYYALALDGQQRPCRVRSSNPGHLLYSGAVRRHRAAAVTRQLTSGALSSGWGIRTLAVEAARFNPMSYHNGSVWPHDVALCAAGMSRYGDREHAVRILGNMFEASVHFGMRLPELFCGFERAVGEAPIAYPVACLPQAWAAGSVFMLLQACLGLNIDGRRGRLLIDRPSLPMGIDRLRIRKLPLGDRTVDLEFHRVDRHVLTLVERQPGAEGITVDVRV